MKYDYFAFLKKERFEKNTYKNFRNDNNIYFFHAKRDELWKNNPGKSKAFYFGNEKKAYSLSIQYVSNNITETGFIKKFSFKISLLSPFFTASENKFYSIQNPIAKDRPTGLPVLKGSSLKGALRQAAVDSLEDELIKESCLDKNYDEILKIDDDKFSFKKRAELVRLFGNEKEVKWFTFKTLLATGGIKDVDIVTEVLEKINSAFEHYLRKNKITDNDGNCKGRLIFEDLHFKKVALDVITPLDRKKRTPVRGPVFYEVVPKGEVAKGKIIWFPFDLIAEGKTKEEIINEWRNDKKIIIDALDKLSKIGIGAKTKYGWGRFK